MGRMSRLCATVVTTLNRSLEVIQRIKDNLVLSHNELMKSVVTKIDVPVGELVLVILYEDLFPFGEKPNYDKVVQFDVHNIFKVLFSNFQIRYDLDYKDSNDNWLPKVVPDLSEEGD